jgi:hypothetical protein
VGAESQAPEAPDTPTPASAGPENRGAARLRRVQFVWYYSLDDSTKRGLAHTVDVSPRGIGLVTTHTMVQGERLFVVVVTRFGRIAMITKVMHFHQAEAGSYRAGLQVEVIPPADKSTWQWLLREERP